MIGFILGKKGITKRMFDEKGNQIPVTHISTKPCYVVAVNKNPAGELMSVKLGFWHAKRIAKPQLGELTAAGIKTPLRFLKEIRIDKKLTRAGQSVELIENNGKTGIKIGQQELFAGSEITPSQLFELGNIVSVTGTSKGKGFAGVVKRHKFAGGPRTHGQSDRERAPGSIGMGTTPGRVFKGKRMAGRMGSDRTTVFGLTVVETNDDELWVKGLVPGPKGTLLEVVTLDAKHEAPVVEEVVVESAPEVAEAPAVDEQVNEPVVEAESEAAEEIANKESSEVTPEEKA